MPIANIVLSLCSGIIGAFIGGYIAARGAIKSVKLTEFYRVRGIFKTALLDISAKLSEDHGHPAALVMDNPIVDNLAISTIAISPRKIRKDLQAKWDKYRYDENIEGIVPSEYTQKGTATARRLIRERLHEIISLL